MTITPRSRSRRARRATPLLLSAALALAGAGGCQSAGSDAPATSTLTPTPRVSGPPAVALGTPQQVTVASSFGPGTEAVVARVTVFAVRDKIAPTIKPKALASHWTSAEVQVCRPKPVVLGFPAWVLGDDKGRTAQITKILHKQFPQPAFDNASTRTGCQRGWVTFVTRDDLKPTKVTFEQTSDVPGAWRITLR